MKIFKNFVQYDNKCVIIVTHSKKVSSYADKVWNISNGKLTVGQ